MTSIAHTQVDGCGGYHYSDSVIHGFSHTHLSGTGIGYPITVVAILAAVGYWLWRTHAFDNMNKPASPPAPTPADAGANPSEPE